MEVPRIRFSSSSETDKTRGSQTWLHAGVSQGGFKSSDAQVTAFPPKSKYLRIGDTNVETSLGTNQLNCKQRDL